MAVYKGPVGFGHDGVHYPVGDDGHLDMSRPLRWIDGDGGYRDAEKGDPLHNDAYHAGDADLEVGGENE
jgi:hypothetical protein